MSLSIKIENFEGPFDLLLHLIKKNEMDIYDIKVYDITNQYLQYIEWMKEMDLEITSEFIVLAATLLEIKSKMLLPKIKNEENDEVLDPRKELVDKLLEYKKYKMVSEFFKERECDAGITFGKKPEIIDDHNNKILDNSELFKGVTMLTLYNLYDKLITTYRNKINTENIISKQIPLDEYKIEDKMQFINNKFIKHARIHFSSLCEDCLSKIEIVVTFLALLELIKLKMVAVVQENNFDEIYIERIDNNEEN